MRKQLVIVLLALLAAPGSTQAQDLRYARGLVEELTQETYRGRGYGYNSDGKTGERLVKEFFILRLLPVGISYFQAFNIDANTFNGRFITQVGDSALQPGADYLVSANSCGIKGTYSPTTDTSWSPGMDTSLYLVQDFSDWYPGQDFSWKKLTRKQKQLAALGRDTAGYQALVVLVDELPYYKPSRVATDFTTFIIERDKWPAPHPGLTVHIDQQLLQNTRTANLMALHRGQSDTMIVFTAHYDHIGAYGDAAYFPGANDNASGTAMVLDLAQHYTYDGESHYSILFLLFSGEELGMLGSQYFVAHPRVKLDKVKMLINLDMVGSGDKGITVVNATENEEAFSLLQKINNEEALLPAVKPRGPAPNSDDWPFHQAGVPAMFVYTEGGYKEYHNIDDKYENLPFSGYEELFKLITSFVEQF